MAKHGRKDSLHQRLQATSFCIRLPALHFFLTTTYCMRRATHLRLQICEPRHILGVLPRTPSHLPIGIRTPIKPGDSYDLEGRGSTLALISILNNRPGGKQALEEQNPPLANHTRGRPSLASTTAGNPHLRGWDSRATHSLLVAAPLSARARPGSEIPRLLHGSTRTGKVQWSHRRTAAAARPSRLPLLLTLTPTEAPITAGPYLARLRSPPNSLLMLLLV